MACSTRKSTELFLLDQPLEKFTDRQLPTGEEVLRRLYSFGCNSKSNREAVVTELVEVWGKARIPTMEIRSIKVKLESVVKKYEKLKINRKRSTDTQQAKEVHFKNELSRLFDISHKDALLSMKNKEDQAFLRDQQTERKMAMGGVDQELDTMIGQQVQVLGYQELMQEVQERSKQTLFVYFCGSKGADGTSWCPDCVEAEPVVQAELQNLPAGSTFIYCQVGDRPYWKDGNNEFRKELKVTSIPTLLKYGTSQQLVEKQCCQPELVRMLLTEEV